MKNPTSSKLMHPRFWTPEQETLVMSIVGKRKKHKPLYQAFAKAAFLTNRSPQAIAIHYYTNLKPTNVTAGNVHKRTATDRASVKQTETNMRDHNIQLVSFVRTLFTRLTPAERAEVTKNLV